MLTAFDAIRSRQSIRKYTPQPVPDRVLLELLQLAHLAPSGFNLQPWYFIVVRDEKIKQLLLPIAMNQPQVMEAPATVVFVADPEAWAFSYPEVLSLAAKDGSLKAPRLESYRRSVDLLFRNGPLGLFGFAKRLAAPIRRFFKPTPTIITSHVEAVAYVRCQTMLAAATFMVAASGVGLGTCPMEGFDEERLKKLLAIPARMTIPVIITVGYPAADLSVPRSTRVPIEERVSIDIFTSKMRRLTK